MGETKLASWPVTCVLASSVAVIPQMPPGSSLWASVWTGRTTAGFRALALETFSSGFKTQLGPFPTMQPWASHLSGLCLSVLLCKPKDIDAIDPNVLW